MNEQNNNDNIFESTNLESSQNVQNPVETISTGLTSEQMSNVVDSNTTLTSTNEEKPKKKSKKLIVLIPIVILIAFCLVGYELFYVRDSKRVITSSITKVFEMAEKSLTDLDKKMIDYNPSEDTVDAKTTIKFTTDYEALKSLSNVTFSGEVAINPKDNKLFFELNASEPNKDIINGQAYIEKNRITFNSNVLNNPYYLEGDKELDLSEVSEELKSLLEVKILDYNTIIKNVKNSIINSINKDKITNKTAKKAINGKEENVLIHTYTIDAEEFRNIMSNVLENLTSEETLSVLEKVFDKDSKEIKEYLNTLQKELKDAELDNEQTITLSIYTDNLLGTFKGFSLTINEGDNKTEIEYVTNNNNGTFKIISDGEELNGTVNYDKNTKTYTIKTEIEEYKYTLNITNANENSNKIELIMDNGESVNKITVEALINNNNNVLDSTLKIGLNVTSKEVNFNAEFALSNNIKVGASIPSIEGNAVNLEDASGEEFADIEERIDSALSNSSLSGLLDYMESLKNELITHVKNEYDYDEGDYEYEYDYDEDEEYEYTNPITKARIGNFRNEFLSLLEAGALQAQMDAMNNNIMPNGFKCYNINVNVPDGLKGRWDNEDNFEGSVLVSVTEDEYIEVRGWLKGDRFAIKDQDHNLRNSDVTDIDNNYDYSNCGGYKG